MKHRRNVFVYVATLLVTLALSFVAVEAAEVEVNLVVNKGKLLVTNAKGEKIIYENETGDLRLIPETSMTSLKGMCVVKVGNVQLILDEGDSVIYNSGQDLEFGCVSGSVEAICGEENFKLAKGEVASLDEKAANKNDSDQKMANNVRFSPITQYEIVVRTPAAGPGILPGVPYSDDKPYASPYL